nr:MAG TPA: endonuclease [Caudoviricetes sp.]
MINGYATGTKGEKGTDGRALERHSGRKVTKLIPAT